MIEQLPQQMVTEQKYKEREEESSNAVVSIVLLEFADKLLVTLLPEE